MEPADRQPWLIRAKLAPPAPPPELVERTRLVDRLRALLDYAPVVSVCASAGAGKTVALAHAARALELPLAWLTLDAGDCAPGRLLAYLQAALAERVPAAAGVADEALAAGVGHADAAALLAQTPADTELTIVLDDADRVADSRIALDVLGAFVGYAPAGVRIVLVGRRDVAAALGARVALRPGASLGEAELAFTRAEAAEALGGDADAAVDATGGWVAGVLFEGWRAPAADGAADPLFDYLATHVLGELEPAQIDLLVRTTLLDVVTPARAAALGIRDAGMTFSSLRTRRIPAAWQEGGLALRVHPRVREYLGHLLDHRDPAELRELRRRHGELLTAEGRAEEAVEELLLADARPQATVAARRAIGGVVERLELALAERWLAELQPTDDDVFTEAAAALAIGREDFAQAAAIAAALPPSRLRLLPPRARALLAWACWHVGRPTLLDGSDARLAANLLELAAPERGTPLPPWPAPAGGPIEALLPPLAYARGELERLVEPDDSAPWVAATGAAARVGALRALGRLEEAREAYAREPGPEARRPGSTWLHGLLDVELMLDLGHGAAARRLLREGRPRISATGSRVLEAHSTLLEAKLALRLDRDPVAAQRLLGALDETTNPAVAYPFLREQIDAWLGWALLATGDDAAALQRLRGAVASMRRGDRILELPTAAVYLAEAEWRAGEEERADAATDLALEAADRQGSRHLLLLALADVPAVAARRLDAEPAPDSAWHAVVRALVERTGDGADAPAVERVRVELCDIGDAGLTVDGAPARLRLRKSFELVAVLLTRPDGSATRAELHDALFHGRDDRSSRAYLRQAVLRAREMLPDELAPVADRNAVRLPQPGAVVSVAARLERMLDETDALVGEARLEALEAAIAVGSAGRYLPETEGAWAAERRQRLADRLNDARLDAAALAFEQGRHGTSHQLATAALAQDPVREDGWRLAMSLAGALGDQRRVLSGYRRCREALARIGVEPSSSTTALFERLRDSRIAG